MRPMKLRLPLLRIHLGSCKPRIPLDYETKTSYIVTVTVTDGKDAVGTVDDVDDDTITVTIRVGNEVEDSDLLNRPPRFLHAPASTLEVA